jgi:two-component system, chemotaxis family, protein-glutamate methylesterase/glutaminase
MQMRKQKYCHRRVTGLRSKIRYIRTSGTHLRKPSPAGFGCRVTESVILSQALPRLPSDFDAVVIGASSGGIETLSRVLETLPRDFAAPIMVVQHSGGAKTHLPEIIGKRVKLIVKVAVAGERFVAGTIYIAPPGRHLEVSSAGCCRLGDGARVSHARPSADVLFRTAALRFGSKTLAVVLTGFLRDGTAGASKVQRCGGLVIAQEPSTCVAPGMPSSVIENGGANVVLAPAKIAEALVSLVMVPGTRDCLGFAGVAA